jgi:hypothetical protein
MPVKYSADIKAARMQQVVSAIDGGPGQGLLKIGTAGMAKLLVSIPLADPSFVVKGAGIEINGPVSAPAVAIGKPAAAQITDSTGAVKIDGLTVGGTGSNIILVPGQISAIGQIISITTAVITHG